MSSPDPMVVDEEHLSVPGGGATPSASSSTSFGSPSRPSSSISSAADFGPSSTILSPNLSDSSPTSLSPYHLSSILHTLVSPNRRVPIHLPPSSTTIIPKSASRLSSSKTKSRSGAQSLPPPQVLPHPVTKTCNSQIRNLLYVPDLGRVATEQAQQFLTKIVEGIPDPETNRDEYSSLAKARKLFDADLIDIDQVTEDDVSREFSVNGQNFLRDLVEIFAPDQTRTLSWKAERAAKRMGVRSDYVFKVDGKSVAVFEFKAMDIISDSEALVWRLNRFLEAIGSGQRITPRELMEQAKGDINNVLVKLIAAGISEEVGTLFICDGATVRVIRLRNTGKAVPVTVMENEETQLLKLQYDVLISRLTPFPEREPDSGGTCTTGRSSPEAQTATEKFKALEYDGTQLVTILLAFALGHSFEGVDIHYSELINDSVTSARDQDSDVVRHSGSGGGGGAQGGGGDGGGYDHDDDQGSSLGPSLGLRTDGSFSLGGGGGGLQEHAVAAPEQQETIGYRFEFADMANPTLPIVFETPDRSWAHREKRSTPKQTPMRNAQVKTLSSTVERKKHSNEGSDDSILEEESFGSSSSSVESHSDSLLKGASSPRSSSPSEPSSGDRSFDSGLGLDPALPFPASPVLKKDGQLVRTVKLSREVGSGHYSTAYRVIGEPAIVKFAQYHGFGAVYEPETFRSEASVLLHYLQPEYLRPYVVRGYGYGRAAVECADSDALVLEGLGKSIKEWDDLTFDEKKHLAIGLMLVHFRGVQHGDLEAWNILRTLDNNSFPKIIDFSHARVGHRCLQSACEELNEFCNDSLRLSPEVRKEVEKEAMRIHRSHASR